MPFHQLQILKTTALQLGWNRYSSGIIGKQGIEPPMQQKVGIRKLNNMINHPHPDVYSAVEILKREQKTTELCILQLVNGAAPPAKKESIQRRKTNFNG